MCVCVCVCVCVLHSQEKAGFVPENFKKNCRFVLVVNKSGMFSDLKVKCH